MSTTLASAKNGFRYIGRGLYTVPEAARITGVPSASVRRWLMGYYFNRSGAFRRSEPVIESELAVEFSGQALSFTDLIEIRFVHAFRVFGVSWPTIRRAAETAREVLKLDHPFAHREFATDGKAILTLVQREIGEPELLNLLNSQYESQPLLTQFLRGEVAFGQNGLVTHWHPLDKRKSIVIDPERSFGQPIVVDGGIPTSILKRAYIAEDESVAMVSKLFDIDHQTVRDALEYEALLAA